ncbi:MAG: FKBP-type peptidyl-prolyl cis-trans isomerase [Gammaproteobacteria bacterium]
MEIGRDCIVSIDFKLTNDKGELLDESAQGEPLVYLHGAAGIVPALQDGLAGKVAGDSFSITIAPEEGFGEYRPGLIQEVPRNAFPPDQDISPGMSVTAAADGGGGPTEFVVRSVAEETVTLDANHPLAGMTVTFAGAVAEVRAATDEEVIKGHPL